MNQSKNIFKSLNSLLKYRVQNINTSYLRSIDQKWRSSKGLHENPTAFGPLTNLSDYTFMDGRPTPLGSRQKQRVMKQREIARKIVTLSNEMEFAKTRYESNLKQKADERQKIIDSKLKQKGFLLLKK